MSRKLINSVRPFLTNPVHGGKVTCYKCGGFIPEGNEIGLDHLYPEIWFHQDCFNPYEHYYGLDKPID